MIASPASVRTSTARDGYAADQPPSHDRPSVVARSYPAPTPLATPTDLTPAEV